jgi:endonuclease/exonuclease/phosphatase family metal-dependent hydrolase
MVINNKLRIVILAFVLLFSLCSHAQNTEIKKGRLDLPDVPGFQTLQCDFHMHTVFSDGHVWPSFRVNEAERDGLDAISLTEHIDYEGYPEEIKRDKNRSQHIGLASVKKNLMLVKGVEISPRVPPYHCNALFLEDANKLAVDYMKNTEKKFVMKDSITHDQLMAPFLEAKRQGAFIFYNHPGYAWWDKKDTAIFTRFHKELLENNMLHGVEVANSGRYNIIAHRLAMKYNLTLLSNSDVHYEINEGYKGSHRPLTLVLAKTRTVEGIKEALLARRTIIYFDDFLVGRKPEIEAFFKAAVRVTTERTVRNGEPLLKIRCVNNSDIAFRVKTSGQFDIEDFPLGQAVLKAKDTTTFILKAVWKYPEQTTLKMDVTNLLVSPDEFLTTEFNLSTKPAEPLKTLKVMSYNIHHANPPSRPDHIDLDAIASVIRINDPDIVALQEIDVYNTRSGKSISEAVELATKTGLTVYFGKAINHAGGEYGVAILSRYPMQGMRTYPLPTIEGTKGEPRVLATAIINLPGGKNILFACTHLDAQRADSNRIAQIREITMILKKEELPLILAGDLNATAGTTVIEVLDKSLERTCKKNCGFTIPIEKPSKTIDFIAHTPGAFNTISHEVIQEKYASDHLPVVAVLGIK